MVRKEVLGSVGLKKVFCKDNDLPVSICSSPYFMQNLKLLDNQSGIVDRFKQFCAELEEYSNDKEYIRCYDKVKNDIIRFIKTQQEYDGFKERKSELTDDCVHRMLYDDINDEETFLCVRFKDAGFSVLKHYAPDMFMNQRTWDGFVKQFTDSQYLVKCPGFQKEILSECGLDDLQKRKKSFMRKLYEYLYNTYKLPVFSIDRNEILIQVPEGGYSFSLKDFRKTVYKYQDGIDELVDVSVFFLNKLKETDSWVRHYLNNKIEIESPDDFSYYQSMKYLRDEIIEDDELII